MARMARRPIRLAAAVLALGLTAGTLAGCSRGNEMTDLPKPSARFCDAGAEYEAALTAKKRPASIEEQVAIVRRMDASAPTDIADETATFLDALEQVQAGDRTAVDSPDVRAALAEVNRRYSQGCGVYDRRGGI